MQGLYLLKTGQVKTISSLADCLWGYRVTIQRWVIAYRHQGLAELLRVKPKTGRAQTIEQHIIDQLIDQLQERFNQPQQGFSSYGEIQDCLQNNYQIQINYRLRLDKI